MFFWKVSQCASVGRGKRQKGRGGDSDNVLTKTSMDSDMSIHVTYFFFFYFKHSRQACHRVVNWTVLEVFSLCMEPELEKKYSDSSRI